MKKTTLQKLLTIATVLYLAYAITDTFFNGYNDWHNIVFVPMIALMILDLSGGKKHDYNK